MSTPPLPSELPVYLGPVLPRWQPRSLADVQAAIDDGTLGERHWLDAKAEVGATDSARKGLAKDLASFANDGGGLLIGVREDKSAGTLAVDPLPLAGLSEAVEQIAHYRCDPPLYIVCHPLSGPADGDGPARGVLLVHVPPSPLAPHMVDGRYYGRGDTTNHQLTDGEVARLHAVRTTGQATAEQVITAEVARDPVPAGDREFSHLHVVAQPLASPPDLLTSLIGSPELSQLVGAVPTAVAHSGSALPDWSFLSHHNEPRAHGSGFHSRGLSARQFRPDLDYAEKGLLDLEVHDDGRLSLFCGRGSDVHQGYKYVNDDGIVALTRSLVTLAGQLAADRGYAGRWLLAVGVTDLTGKAAESALASQVMGGGHSRYSADSYVQGTEAVTAELLDRPGAVTRRLVGRLLRALGKDADQGHQQRLADPAAI